MSQHIARKRFGQHFLCDEQIITDIIDGITPQKGDAMVEIGPGLGALTFPLQKRLQSNLQVIELDRDLAKRLRHHEPETLTVIESDVLRVDFVALANVLCNTNATNQSSQSSLKLRVVGNLPYNISTPILFHLLDAVHVVKDQHFMLQKEVIDRMVAQPDTSDYSRLSVMLQWRYDMANILFVPPESFNPPPRVDSAIVRMVPHAVAALVDTLKLEAVVRVAFSQKRKLVKHTLGKWLDEQQFTGIFDVQRRAQEIPVAEFLTLAQTLSPLRPSDGGL